MSDLTLAARIRWRVGTALACAGLVVAASLAAGSSAAGPSQLWYQLSVVYHGELHQKTSFYGGDTRYCCGSWATEINAETGYGYPANRTIETNGYEHIELILDRCPGSKPC